MEKCETCGKYIPRDGCLYYCSFVCCEKAIVNSAGGLGVNEEAAVQEVQELCGEGCPY